MCVLICRNRRWKPDAMNFPPWLYFSNSGQLHFLQRSGFQCYWFSVTGSVFRVVFWGQQPALFITVAWHEHPALYGNPLDGTESELQGVNTLLMLHLCARYYLECLLIRCKIICWNMPLHTGDVESFLRYVGTGEGRCAP